MTTKQRPITLANGTRLTPPGARPYWRVAWVEPSTGERRSTWRSEAEDAAQTAQEVDRQLGDMQLAVMAGQHWEPPAPTLTFDDLVLRYLDPTRHDNEWTQRYATNVARVLRLHVLPHIGSLLPDELSAAHARDVLATMRGKGLARATQMQALSTLRGLIRVAREDGLLDRDPTDIVKLPARRHQAGEDASYVSTVLRPPTSAVADLAAAAEVRHEWWRPLEVNVAAFLGLRQGELWALRARHVNLETRRIRILEQHDGELPKGGVTRSVAILAWGRIAEPLERRLAELGPDDRLFPSASGGLSTHKTFYRYRFRPWCEDADWPKDDGKWRWSWHDLRHHAATWMLEELNAQPHQVSVQLGHASAAFTMRRYVSRSASNLDQLVELDRR